MKVLFVHNAYQHRGGEDAVVDAEISMLIRNGHTVEIFNRHNDAIHAMNKVNLAVQTVWSAESAREFDKLTQKFRPDLIHVHNTFPLISPAIYWTAAKRQLPVVQTLHNFRLLCPQAMFLRDGSICEDCLGNIPWRGATRRCYRGSAAQSTVLAGMLTMHRVVGTWQTKVTRYIALNEFCRRKFIQGGLPEDRIRIKPNFVDFPVPPEGDRTGFLFVGRLSPEKGLHVLADAAGRLPSMQIRIAGTGPESAQLKHLKNTEELGALDANAVRNEMTKAEALLLPSIWYENFPRTLVEGFACGLPVIASRLGALAELVEDSVTGLLFDPGSGADLAEKMAWASAHPKKMRAMGAKARKRYEAEFTESRNYAQLMSIYEDAMHARAHGTVST